jgi:hypothetical protein
MNDALQLLEGYLVLSLNERPLIVSLLDTAQCLLQSRPFYLQISLNEEIPISIPSQVQEVFSQGWQDRIVMSLGK